MGMIERQPNGKELRAMQRHADYYIGLLMDPEKDREVLYPEMGQITLARKRVLDELVGARYHSGQIEMKYREVSGGFVEVMLPKLVRGEVNKENFGQIETAVGIVESGIVAYPISSQMLRIKLEGFRKSLL